MSAALGGEHAELLSRLELFRGLDRVTLAKLAAHLEPVVVAAVEVLCRQGDPGDGLYLVSRGTFGVYAEGVAGEVRLSTCGRGDAIGEIALLSGEARTATIRADEDGEVLRLNQARFLSLVRAEPSVALAISAGLIKQLRQADAARLGLEQGVAPDVAAAEPARRVAETVAGVEPARRVAEMVAAAEPAQRVLETVETVAAAARRGPRLERKRVALLLSGGILLLGWWMTPPPGWKRRSGTPFSACSRSCRSWRSKRCPTGPRHCCWSRSGWSAALCPRAWRWTALPLPRSCWPSPCLRSARRSPPPDCCTGFLCGQSLGRAALLARLPRLVFRG